MHYGDELATVVKNMILISEVAILGKEIAKYGDRAFKKGKLSLRDSHAVLSGFLVCSADVADTDEKLPVVNDTDSSSEIDADKVIDEERKNKLTGTLSTSQRLRVEDLLGQWEEPDTVAELEVFDVPCICPATQCNERHANIHFVLHHRRTFQSLQFYSFDRCLPTWTKIILFLLPSDLPTLETIVLSQHKNSTCSSQEILPIWMFARLIPLLSWRRLKPAISILNK